MEAEEELLIRGREGILSPERLKYLVYQATGDLDLADKKAAELLASAINKGSHYV